MVAFMFFGRAIIAAITAVIACGVVFVVIDVMIYLHL